MRKGDVDIFTMHETSWIPHSHFKAKCHLRDISVIPDLECKVHIKGAKPPHNEFTFDIIPQGILNLILIIKQAADFITEYVCHYIIL